MGRQIHFFLSPSMRVAIEGEALHRNVKLVSHSPASDAIEFSHDGREGRLWTDAGNTTNYDALCRIVKKGAVYDPESGLWVKRDARPAFVVYKKEKADALAQLVEKNRKYAIEVLGGRPVSDKKPG